MKIRVRCFAAVRELLGADEVTTECPAGATVGELLAQLALQAPPLRRMALAFAVNQEYASKNTVLQDGDEVAFIPPISGGHDRADAPDADNTDADAPDADTPTRVELCRFDLTTQQIEPRRLEAEARTDGDGAVVTFTGVTRNHNDGCAVAALRYECYEDMARKVMGRLFEQAMQSFEIGRVRVAHRLGHVPIGEACVVVVVAAAHREPAFAAARFLMDRLKAEVPIFKHEQLDDGGERWIGELPPAPGDPRNSGL